MFLCDNCHRGCGCFALRSYGRCENCREAAQCSDCHTFYTPPTGKKKEVPKSEPRRRS